MGRPRTAGRKPKSPTKDKRYASTLKNSHLRSRSIMKATQSQEVASNTLAHVSVKTIGMVNAYQPNRLKKCMVKNPKNYGTFFGQIGACGIKDIYLRSVLAHFREWRDHLKRKMLEVFELISATEDLLEGDLEERVQIIMGSLGSYTDNFRRSLEEVLHSGTSSPNATKLHQTFQSMEEALKHLTRLISFLFSFSRKLQSFFSEAHSTFTSI